MPTSMSLEESLMETRPRPLNLERRSLEEKTLSDLSISVTHPRGLETVRSSDGLESMSSPRVSIMSSPRISIRSGTPLSGFHTPFATHPMVADAWDSLRKSLVYFRGKPVGTIAALDSTEDALNYNQVCLRSPEITQALNFQLCFSHYAKDLRCL